MNFGAILRGALQGGAAMQLGRTTGKNQATQYGIENDLKERDREIREAQIRRQQAVDDEKERSDAIRLQLEERRTKAAEENATANTIRAKRPAGGAAGGRIDPGQQKLTIARRVQVLMAQGVPSHIASITARNEQGLPLNEAESRALDRYERKKAQDASTPAPSTQGPPNYRVGPKVQPGDINF